MWIRKDTMRTTRAQSIVIAGSLALAAGLVPVFAKVGATTGNGKKNASPAPPNVAQDSPEPADHKIAYSPYPKKNFPNRVYFGDTHLHTSYSAHAGMIGNTLGPE